MVFFEMAVGFIEKRRKNGRRERAKEEDRKYNIEIVEGIFNNANYLELSLGDKREIEDVLGGLSEKKLEVAKDAVEMLCAYNEGTINNWLINDIKTVKVIKDEMTAYKRCLEQALSVKLQFSEPLTRFFDSSEDE